MKLQGLKRIERNDFPSEFKDVIERIGYAFNSFAEEVIDGFNNGRISMENLNRNIVTFKVEVSGAGVPVDDLIIQPNVSNLQGFSVINVSSDNAVPNACPFITYNKMNSGAVRITHIAGLPSGTSFTVKVEAIGN